jgi:hypothetical protein
MEGSQEMMRPRTAEASPARKCAVGGNGLWRVVHLMISSRLRFGSPDRRGGCKLTRALPVV